MRALKTEESSDISNERIFDKTDQKVEEISIKLDELMGVVNDRVLGREQREVQFNIFLYALICAVSSGALVTCVFGFLGIYYPNNMRDVYIYSGVISSVSIIIFWALARRSLNLTIFDFEGIILKKDLIDVWHETYQLKYEKLNKITINVNRAEDNSRYYMKFLEDNDKIGAVRFDLKHMTFRVATTTKHKVLISKLKEDFDNLKSKGFVKITKENIKSK